MKYRIVKNSNLSLSRIGFGCANFGGIGSAPDLVGKGDSEKDSHHLLDAAFASGINYYDTAPTYGAGNSEKILGKWLSKKNIPRDKVIISSKISSRNSFFPWRRGLSRGHVINQIDESLKRLQLSYLDILYIHSPDPKTPLEVTLGALNDAVVQGKVRKLGISNVDTDYLKHTLKVSRTNAFHEIEVVQNSYNFLAHSDDKELIPFCRANQILYVGYGPLSGGMLSGKYKKGCDFPENTRLHLRGSLYRSELTDSTFGNIEKLHSFARSLDISLPSLMYAWLYERSPLDVFLIGTRNDAQFNDVLKALTVDLSESDWQELNNLCGNAAAIE